MSPLPVRWTDWFAAHDRTAVSHVEIEVATRTSEARWILLVLMELLIAAIRAPPGTKLAACAGDECYVRLMTLGRQTSSAVIQLALQLPIVV